MTIIKHIESFLNSYAGITNFIGVVIIPLLGLLLSKKFRKKTKLEIEYVLDIQSDAIKMTVFISNIGDKEVCLDNISLLNAYAEKFLLLIYGKSTCLNPGQREKHTFDKRKTGLNEFIMKMRRESDHINNFRIVVTDTLGKKWYSKRHTN